MPKVFIAGATGYLGHFLCAEYQSRGWQVHALVRNADSGSATSLAADELVEAEATKPETLKGKMAGADLVISTLGITRQKDGLSYWDVDYQANLNLLNEAARAGVPRFCYVHVLGADKMRGVPLVDAKQAFVDALQAAEINSTIIAPSGYFSDMSDFLGMAKSGRAWLFGDGQFRLNPIHGADLAAATAEAIEAGENWLDVGGPDVFTHNQLAELAFSALGTEPRITRLPDFIRRAAIAIAKILPQSIGGPLRFFLTGFGMDMMAPKYGSHHLKDHFEAEARK